MSQTEKRKMKLVRGLRLTWPTNSAKWGQQGPGVHFEVHVVATQRRPGFQAGAWVQPHLRAGAWAQPH